MYSRKAVKTTSVTYPSRSGFDTRASTVRPGTARPSTSRHSTTRPSTSRPGTSRSRSGFSTLGVENQDIICAISESRGVSPVVGIAFVNLDTGEAVISQINDTQTFVRTVHKIAVFNPSVVLIVSTAASPKSKLFSILEDSLNDIEGNLVLLDRRYWAESAGLEYLQRLAFREDLEALKVAVDGNYYAVCCFAAAIKYIELGLSKAFEHHSLRIKYEPAEGCMMIDVATIRALELVQNLTNVKSKDSLFGLLNETLTPMGGRLLRSNLLQPSCSVDVLAGRYEAVEELSTKEQLFIDVRTALKPFKDADRTLTALILLPTQISLQTTEQAINNVLALKHYIGLIGPVHTALLNVQSPLLQDVCALSAPRNIGPARTLINDVLNSDATYASKPLDLRNQRTYAVKSGVNGMLDVARQTYKEAMEDAMQYISSLGAEHSLPLQTKFDTARQFYIRLHRDDLEDRDLPNIFIYVFRKREWIECQTLELLKLNQRMSDSHSEAISMSDKSVQDLIVALRQHIAPLFKICEGIAMLDMVAAFAHLATTHDYTRPLLNETLALSGCKHPVRSKNPTSNFVPNDVYATQQKRFHIVTGCNMSGKSTYIRSIALLTIMAQVGSFVPADFASFSIRRQLLARVSTDDSIEANISTFAAEMREAAFILSNVDRDSLVIVDELGRGTSTRDGLAIAIAIAEALIESRALVWFASHFHELAAILAERNGVVNCHLAVDNSREDKIEMLYRVTAGAVQDRHYGIKLAKVLPFPPDVIETAEQVSSTLKQITQQRSTTSMAVITARKRRLLLNLREQLMQARDSSLDDEKLAVWLSRLQREFIMQLTALDDQEKALLGLKDDLEHSMVDDDRSTLRAPTSCAEDDFSDRLFSTSSAVNDSSLQEAISYDYEPMQLSEGRSLGSVAETIELRDVESEFQGRQASSTTILFS